jgi:hypothetical protein
MNGLIMNDSTSDRQEKISFWSAPLKWLKHQFNRFTEKDHEKSERNEQERESLQPHEEKNRELHLNGSRESEMQQLFDGLDVARPRTDTQVMHEVNEQQKGHTAGAISTDSPKTSQQLENEEYAREYARIINENQDQERAWDKRLREQERKKLEEKREKQGGFYSK